MIYCVKCRNHTEDIGLTPHISKNGRPMVKSKCACGTTKNRFVSNNEVREGGSLAGLFSGLMPLLKTVATKVLPVLGLSAVSGAISGATNKAVKGSGRKRVTDAMIRKYARDRGYGNIKKGSGIWSFIKGIFT